MPLSAEEIVERHKEAVEKCKGKKGWDALECINNILKKEIEEQKKEENS